MNPPASTRRVTLAEFFSRPKEGTSTMHIPTGIFQSVGHFFHKYFGNVPAWNKIGLATLTVAAPLVDAALTIAMPTAEPQVEKILDRVKSGMVEASVLMESGEAHPSLPGVLDGITENLKGIEQLANIANPESKAKFELIIKTLDEEVKAIRASIPATAS